MSTTNTPERIEEAKALYARITSLVQNEKKETERLRIIMIVAGLLTETLLEYEEPDAVMEQSFHRVADLLGVEPAEGDLADGDLPLPYMIDHDTELGRKLARKMADKLPGDMDDVHEIALALVINDFPLWEQEDAFYRQDSFRILIECVIFSMLYEMAAQEFCDIMIEEFISEDWTVGTAISTMSALAGYHLQNAFPHDGGQVDETREAIIDVISAEIKRLGVRDKHKWDGLGVANDLPDDSLIKMVVELDQELEEFFEDVGIDRPLVKATALAKATGRMIAVASIEEVGHIHASVAKTLAKSGLIQGTRMVI